MLDPQVVVNLSAQVCVGVDFVDHRNVIRLRLPHRRCHRVSQQNDRPDGYEQNHAEGNQLR